MTDWSIRKLTAGDERLLTSLAQDADGFEEEGAVERPPRPLSTTDASAFLEDPATHLWVERMLAWARRTELRRGFLLAGQGNAAAIAFYSSLGWVAEDEADLVFGFDLE